MAILNTLLLVCCHFLISSWFFLVGLLRRLRLEVREMKHSSLDDELEKCKLSVMEFKKMPEHLGIVINEEAISFEDIAHIIVWCLAVGVPYVSVYDLRGFVKSNKARLYYETVTVKDKILKENAQKYTILYSDSLRDHFSNVAEKILAGKTCKYKMLFESSINNNEIQNGKKSEGKIHINLLSKADGKADIVHAVREVCQDVIKEAMQSTDVQQLHISKHLHSLTGSPDPDAVVCFGRGQSLIGYLPWQIRLSEIMFFSTHHKFHINEFMRVLELFNHCEQRFGK